MQNWISTDLNFPVEEVPRQELERDHPVVRQVEQVHRVDHLLGRHHQVDHLKNGSIVTTLFFISECVVNFGTVLAFIFLSMIFTANAKKFKFTQKALL
jgi:hypothetical protein